MPKLRGESDRISRIKCCITEKCSCTGANGSAGSTGPTGPIGPLVSGTFFGDYLYWNDSSENWTIGSNTIRIGKNAGHTGLGVNSVAIGEGAHEIGIISQYTPSNLVSIGYRAGNTNQSAYTVAIGTSAGESSQNPNAVAVGANAGAINQGSSAVALGQLAGHSNQGESSIAIGYNAASYNQGSTSIAIGNNTGNFQGEKSIALGCSSGYSQGNHAIVIGYEADNGDQSDNSIIINASQAKISAQQNGLYMAPIRDISFSNVLYYDTASKEIGYGDSSAIKTFVIDHPTDPSRYLVHACLEGPEAGVYYRGTGEIHEGETAVTVQIPPYATAIARDFTVQLTPIFNGCIQTQPFMASRVLNGEFTVVGPTGEFYWHVYGMRQAIEVEPRRSDVAVRGEGPYKWI